MKWFLLSMVLLTSFVMVACAPFQRPSHLVTDEDVRIEYFEQIKKWQNRVKEEGWSERLVDDIVYGCVKLSVYQFDQGEDNWQTPKGMIENGLRGDCEDFAAVIFGTLKALGYPHDVRILIVFTPIPVAHAMVRVRLPSGEFKTYNSTPSLLGALDELFYNPYVEFDEQSIWIF